MGSRPRAQSPSSVNKTSCAPDTSLTNGGVSPLPCPVLAPPARRATSAHGQGDLRITVRASPSSASPRASHSSSASHHLVFPDGLAVSSDRVGPSISFGAPADNRMSIAASEGELGSGDDDSAALPPSGRVMLPESDPGLTAMLSRAAESVGLHWRPPPSPECSRLDDWFLGVQADHRQSPPVPFFPEVHEEVNSSWGAQFSARNRASASSVLTALDDGVAKGYVEIPPVERAIAVQLCPRAPLPGKVIHASRPGLVGSRPFQRPRLTELLDRPPLPGCSPSARSSPRAPSCCPHLCSSAAPAAAFTPAAAWSWQQESGAARLCPCQAREVPGQAAFLGRANPRHWVLLFRRW